MPVLRSKLYFLSKTFNEVQSDVLVHTLLQTNGCKAITNEDGEHEIEYTMSAPLNIIKRVRLQSLKEQIEEVLKECENDGY